MLRSILTAGFGVPWPLARAVGGREDGQGLCVEWAVADDVARDKVGSG